MAVNAQPIAAMHKEYSYYTSGSKTCCGCCNYQKSPLHENVMCCIAFGVDERYNYSWSPSSTACGIYNKPYVTLRPKRRQLIEMIVSKKPVVSDNVPSEQASFL